MNNSLDITIPDNIKVSDYELLEEEKAELTQAKSRRQMHRECLKRVTYALKNGNQMFLLKTLAYGEGLASSNNFMATKVND